MQKTTYATHINWIKSLKVGDEVGFNKQPITLRKVTAIYPNGFSRSDLTLTGYIVEVDGGWYFNVDAETADEDYQDWHMIFELSENDHRELRRLRMISDIKSVYWDNKSYEIVDEFHKTLESKKLFNRKQ